MSQEPQTSQKSPEKAESSTVSDKKPLTSLQVSFTIEHEDPTEITKINSDVVAFLKDLIKDGFVIVRCKQEIETRLSFPNR